MMAFLPPYRDTEVGRLSRNSIAEEIPSSQSSPSPRNPTLTRLQHGFFAPPLFALLLIPAATSGCATTQPWERELLAKRVMAPDEDPDDAALRTHYFGTREGAVGSLGGGGGGCGCN
jgi:hypothetical protein